MFTNDTASDVAQTRTFVASMGLELAEHLSNDNAFGALAVEAAEERRHMSLLTVVPSRRSMTQNQSMDGEEYDM